MRKSTLIVATVMFVSVLFVGVTFLPDARAATRYVGGGGPGNYTTIQAAIDDAGPGDTVFVYNGTYLENLVVNRTLSLLGEDRETTIVQGNGTGDVIHVSADWVNISGFTFRDGGSGVGDAGMDLDEAENCNISYNKVTWSGEYGILLTSSGSNTISNNDVFSTGWTGIRLYMSDDNILSNNNISSSLATGISTSSSDGITLHNNTIWNQTYGIKLAFSNRATITNNTVAYSRWEGISLDNSVDGTIENNTMIDNGITIFGWFVSEWNTHTITTTNTVNAKPVYYWKDVVGGTVPSGAGQVILANCTGVTVENQNVSDASIGIEVGHSSWIVLANNTAENDWYGIFFFRSDNGIIDNNTVSNSNEDGMWIDSSRDNLISNNTAMANEYGVLLWGSNSNTVTGNNASDNRDGIRLMESHDNDVVGNNVTWSGGAGISLYGSEGTTIAGNDILNSYNEGMFLHDSHWNTFESNNLSKGNEGFYILSSSNNTLVNNTVSSSTISSIRLFSSSHNRIIDNAFVASSNQPYDDNQTNEWDDGYPAGGNYWSDYAGNDNMSGPNQNELGSDGIGDTPYDIEGGVNRDRYPLMGEPPVPPYPPSVPKNVQATARRQRVTLTWDPPAFDGRSQVTNYTIYRGTVPGGETFLVEIGNVHNLTDLGLTNGQTYYYQLSAKNGVGEGPRSDEVNATPSPLPWPPANLTAVAGNGQVTLSWSAPAYDGDSPITNYTVHRGTSSGGESFLTQLGDTLGFLDTNVTNGVVYYYQVAAVNVAGEGPMSAEVSALPVGPPSAPQNLHVIGGDGNVSLTWDPPAVDGGFSIMHYLIYRGLTTGGEVFLQNVGNVTSYADFSVTNGQEYFYQVSAVNLKGMSPMSEEVSVTPLPPPAAPLDIGSTLTGQNLENVTITWSPSPDDGTGLESVLAYEIRRGSSYSASGFGYQFLSTIPNGTFEFTNVLSGMGDSSSYFYRLCAVDFNGNTGCALVQAAKFTRPLAQGPNLISIPLVQSNTGMEYVLQTVKWDKAWSYDSSSREWKSSMKDKTYSRGLSNFNQTMGLWVNVTGDCNLTVAGVVPAQTTIHLHQGWNLVSFPSFNTTFTVADLKAETGATRVEGFDSAPPYFLRVLGDAEALQAGYGYWMSVQSEMDWVVKIA